jgi:hypothetical protein
LGGSGRGGACSAHDDIPSLLNKAHHHHKKASMGKSLQPEYAGLKIVRQTVPGRILSIGGEV